MFESTQWNSVLRWPAKFSVWCWIKAGGFAYGSGIISGHNASQQSISVNGKAGEVHPMYHGVKAAPFRKGHHVPELVGLFPC